MAATDTTRQLQQRQVLHPPFANALGLPSPDLRATSIVALVNQADYEWVGKDSVSWPIRWKRWRVSCSS